MQNPLNNYDVINKEITLQKEIIRRANEEIRFRAQQIKNARAAIRLLEREEVYETVIDAPDTDFVSVDVKTGTVTFNTRVLDDWEPSLGDSFEEKHRTKQVRANRKKKRESLKIDIRVWT